MQELPALTLLLRAYLNIDWPEDYGDTWLGVEDFARREPNLAPALRDEIAAVLSASPTEADLRRVVVEELGSGNLPDADGWTYRAWLEEVARRVNAQTP